MAQQPIRTGDTNNPTGDSLKNAFTKVNANFEELYNALGLGDNLLNLGNFKFTGSTISLDDLEDSTLGITIDTQVNVTSNLSVGGDIVPQTANGGDLGSSTLPWRSLYVSNNTIYIGGTAVGLDANGNLTTGGTVVGSSPAWTNITGKPTFATVATSGAYGDLSGRPTIPTLTSQLTNDSNFITTAVLANGLDADIKGSVFGDDSSLLVDAVDGIIYGNVSATTLRTIETEISIGFSAGSSPGGNTVSIGYGAGQTGQGVEAVSVGVVAGQTSQGNYAVAVGSDAGSSDQGDYAVAIGPDAGHIQQGLYAVAIGRKAGETTQPAGSIIINASGGALNGSAAGLYINPVRNTAGTGNILQYNDSTKEITYSSNLELTGDIRSEGNINIDINLSDSTLRRWQFGEDGELTLPEDAVVKTISGNLTIQGQSYVFIDSATNGQIEIGRSSGVGAVALGNKSNGTNVVVDDLFVANGVYEFFSSLADATGVVTHNCANGHLFYHTSPDANWTVNLTNLLDTWNRATSVTLIIAQGAIGYYPSAVQIAGVAQTINWQGNATPTPSTNRTDVVTFSIINNSGTYIVLGQLTGF